MAAGMAVRQSDMNFHTGPWFSTWSGFTRTPRYLNGSGRSDHSCARVRTWACGRAVVLRGAGERRAAADAPSSRGPPPCSRACGSTRSCSPSTAPAWARCAGHWDPPPRRPRPPCPARAGRGAACTIGPSSGRVRGSQGAGTRPKPAGGLPARPRPRATHLAVTLARRVQGDGGDCAQRGRGARGGHRTPQAVARTAEVPPRQPGQDATRSQHGGGIGAGFARRPPACRDSTCAQGAGYANLRWSGSRVRRRPLPLHHRAWRRHRTRRAGRVGELSLLPWKVQKIGGGTARYGG